MNEMEMRGCRVLITGGAGFIGSALARRLVANDAEVTLIDSMQPNCGGNLANLRGVVGRAVLHVADLNDAAAIVGIVRGQDYVFHLAGQSSHLDSMENPFVDLDANTRATLHLLEACRRHAPCARIVYTGTRQIYGRPQYLPVDEKHPIAPIDVNGVHKVAGEWHHRVYHTAYGMRISVLRLTNTYGPGMRVKDARQTFLGVWIRNLLLGRPIDIYGDGMQRRDFDYVDDVVDALITSADDAAIGTTYNLGGGEVIELNDLAAMLGSMRPGGVARCVPFPADRLAIDIGDYYADSHAIGAALGWAPRVDLQEGLRRTVEYYAAHLEEYL